VTANYYNNNKVLVKCQDSDPVHLVDLVYLVHLVHLVCLVSLVYWVDLVDLVCSVCLVHLDNLEIYHDLKMESARVLLLSLRKLEATSSDSDHSIEIFFGHLGCRGQIETTSE
jgi:hypothetical protein